MGFSVDRHSNIVIEAALCREFLVINKPVAHIMLLAEDMVVPRFSTKTRIADKGKRCTIGF
jgi:hypothetical protein